MRVLAALAVSCAIIVLASGCASTPRSHFYTLSATTDFATASSDLSVIVGPVSIPDIVDRPQIVISDSPNQMRLDEFNRWASPLQDNLSRVVAANLVVMLGTERVTLFHQMMNANADYRAAMDVQRFESAPGKTAVLDAVWTVLRTKDSNSKTGRTTVSEAVEGKGYEALVAAYSRAVTRLSRDIALAIQALDRSGQ